MKRYIKPTYVKQLPKDEQLRIRNRLIQEGLSGEALEDAMNSKLVDIDYDRVPDIQELRECDDIMSDNDVTDDVKSPKDRALETLRTVKQIYENDDSGILVASFYSDFMTEVDEQIREVENYGNW